MSIVYDSDHRCFSLITPHTLYQMQIGPLGYLLHLYYGRRAEGCFDGLQLPRDCGFSPNPYELQEERSWSLDTVAQEYSGSNCGDYRLPCLDAETEQGVRGADLRYRQHEILPGKYTLSGLPCADDRNSNCETLCVMLEDDAQQLRVELLYAVWSDSDVLARSARITNIGGEKLRLYQAASCCLELPFGEWDFISFHGRHAMEMQEGRCKLMHGIQSVASRRGTSSHQHNPFTVLAARDAGEEHGECYGLMPIYSGNHRTDVELDQADSVRAVTGINRDGFSWLLEPGQTFEAPETLLCFSFEGLGGLRRRLHRFLHGNLIPDTHPFEKRPVLLNSWEAMFMDFDAQKLLAFAREAKELDIELLVIDDGWFEKRDDDRRALGDWFTDRRKFPDGLEPVLQEIRAMGLKTGLWIEPEMVSEDSALFRQHPDWALRVPGRKPTVGRSQLVLDLSRQDVTDWLYGRFSCLLKSLPLDYIKWDMNRHLSDLYSPLLPPERQGEVAHRYLLGLYGLLRRLTGEFPEILFEGCSGGGGRFDAGMLAFFPQIWASDNTDAVARLSIQSGTTAAYPVSSVGSHVSVSPNQQTGRSTPLGTRGTVAMAGALGYELDPKLLGEEEKEEIRGQIARFHTWQKLIGSGDYYRLEGTKGRFTAWQQVSQDRKETLVSLVLTQPEGNPVPLHLRLKGLDPEKLYSLTFCGFYGCKAAWPEQCSVRMSGSALMYAGVTLPQLFGDYPSVQLHWTA